MRARPASRRRPPHCVRAAGGGGERAEPAPRAEAEAEAEAEAAARSGRAQGRARERARGRARPRPARRSPGLPSGANPGTTRGTERPAAEVRRTGTRPPRADTPPGPRLCKRRGAGGEAGRAMRLQRDPVPPAGCPEGLRPGRPGREAAPRTAPRVLPGTPRLRRMLCTAGEEAAPGMEGALRPGKGRLRPRNEGETAPWDKATTGMKLRPLEGDTAPGTAPFPARECRLRSGFFRPQGGKAAPCDEAASRIRLRPGEGRLCPQDGAAPRGRGGCVPGSGCAGRYGCVQDKAAPLGWGSCASRMRLRRGRPRVPSRGRRARAGYPEPRGGESLPQAGDPAPRVRLRAPEGALSARDALRRGRPGAGESPRVRASGAIRIGLGRLGARGDF